MMLINVKTFNKQERLIDSCDMFFLNATKEIPIEVARSLLKGTRAAYVTYDSNGYRLSYTRTYG
jgi:hypothetical protein